LLFLESTGHQAVVVAVVELVYQALAALAELGTLVVVVEVNTLLQLLEPPLDKVVGLLEVAVAILDE
jgi:hypothetical protein